MFDEEDDENEFSYRWLEGDSLAPPCQVEELIIEQIINLANPNENDLLCDLGCGDGRICIYATKLYGILMLINYLIRLFYANKLSYTVRMQEYWCRN